MFTSTTVAVFGLSALVIAHIKMSSPVPFGLSSLNNSPLIADGSDFPCKQRPGVYDAQGANNIWPHGSTQSLEFQGSAVHGGGSCQVSVTYDEAPTASSSWKVIHSIEGGCPMKNIVGNNGDNAAAVVPDKFPFKVPESLPTGTAVMAWTWFNKMGNREMYMNCAPITITVSNSKRSEEELEGHNTTQLRERQITSFNALPDMFTANIKGGSCGTVASKDVVFPDPGDSLDMDGPATPEALASPTNCGVPTGASSYPQYIVKPTQPAGAVIPGGIFAAVSVKASASSVNNTVSATPYATPTPGGKAPGGKAPGGKAPIVGNAQFGNAPVATPTPPPASPGSSGPSIGVHAAGSPCSTEGMWNCVGGSSFQRCASGTWSTIQGLSAGTICSPGESVAIQINAISKAKRAVRFSAEHIHRHARHRH